MAHRLPCILAVDVFGVLHIHPAFEIWRLLPQEHYWLFAIHWWNDPVLLRGASTQWHHGLYLCCAGSPLLHSSLQVVQSGFQSVSVETPNASLNHHLRLELCCGCGDLRWESTFSEHSQELFHVLWLRRRRFKLGSLCSVSSLWHCASFREAGTSWPNRKAAFLRSVQFLLLLSLTGRRKPTIFLLLLIIPSSFQELLHLQFHVLT
mmetsp:Transcript_14180/g.32120  ORF Transcript_14180/g.32120 Transcript_14180/m.32120 type:complete len:206 (+) Transcript_14180:741-1358(+)